MQVIVAFAISVAAVAQRSTSHAPNRVRCCGSDPVAFGLVDSIARPWGSDHVFEPSSAWA